MHRHPSIHPESIYLSAYSTHAPHLTSSPPNANANATATADFLPLHAHPLLHIPHLARAHTHALLLTIERANTQDDGPPFHTLQAGLVDFQLGDGLGGELEFEDAGAGAGGAMRDTACGTVSRYGCDSRVVGVGLMGLVWREEVGDFVGFGVEERGAAELVAQDLERVLGEAVCEALEGFVEG